MKEKDTGLENSANDTAKIDSSEIMNERSLKIRKKRMADNQVDEAQFLSNDKDECLEISVNDTAKAGCGVTIRRSLRKRRVADNDAEEVQFIREDDNEMSNDKDECLEISSNDAPKAGCKRITSKKSLRKRRRVHNHTDEVQLFCTICPTVTCKFETEHLFLKISMIFFSFSIFKLGF